MEYFFYLLIFLIPYLALSPWQKLLGVPTGVIYACLVALFVLGMIIQKPRLIRWSGLKQTPLIVPLGIFLAVNLASMLRILVIKGLAGLQSNNVKELGFLIFAIVFYWAVVNFIDNQEKWRNSLLALIVTSTAASLYGIGRLILYLLGSPLGQAQPWTVPRLVGTAGESQVFGGLIITILPFLVALVLYKSKCFKGPLTYLAAAVMLLALIMTFGAGPWAGFAVSMVFLALWVHYYNLKQAVSVVLVFSAVFLCVVIIDRAVYPNYAEGFTSISQKITGQAPPPENFQGRETFTVLQKSGSPVKPSGSSPVKQSKDTVYVESVFSKVERSWFRAALVNMFKSSPVLGVGPGNFEYLYNDFRPPGTPSPPYVPKPHNQYLEIMAETGLVGLLAFGYVVLSIVVSLVLNWPGVSTENKKLLLGLTASLIAVGVHGYAFGILVHIQVWLLPILMLSLVKIDRDFGPGLDFRQV